MRKRYRKRVATVEAEQFRPDLHSELPEGVYESLTPGKYWLRSTTQVKGRRIYTGGIPVQPFDYIVTTKARAGITVSDGQFVMSQEEFTLAYEEALI